MLTELKRTFKPVPAEVLAAEELEEAKRTLLLAQSQQEYWTQMVAYHETRILRLTQQTAAYKEAA